MTTEPLRILLVADDPGQIRRAGEGLQREGSGPIFLEGADSLATARRRLSAGAFDLAILDLGLGDEPGVEVLADFRAIAPEIPVVVLARVGHPGDREGSLAAGATDCVFPEALDGGGLVDRLRAAATRFRVETRAIRVYRQVADALEGAGDVVWHWEPGGQIWLSCPNPDVWGLAGDPDTESAEALRDRIHPDDRERAVRTVTEALAGEGAWRVEARLRVGGGGYRWCECRGRVWRSAGGVLEMVAGVTTDIQRQHNALRELDSGRAQLRAVLDSDPVPQAILNASGFVVDCSRAWLEFDHKGCHAGARFRPGTNFLVESREGDRSDLSVGELARGVRQVLGGGSASFTCEYQAGRRRWRIQVFPLLNPGIAGAIVRHEEVAADEGERPGSRLAVLETALEGLPGPWFRLDREFRVVEAGGGAGELCTRAPKGRDLLRVLSRPDADAVAKVLAEAGKRRDPAWADASLPGGAGTWRWGARAIRRDTRIMGFVVFAVDVSDLVAEEVGLEIAREATLASPVGMALVEGQGGDAVIRWSNPFFAALSGKGEANAVGRKLADHIAGAGRWDAGELDQAMAEPGAGRRVTLHRYDGAAWELAFANAGRFLCVTATDVADRERAVGSLKDLRRRLQGALRGSGDGAWEWDESTGRGWLSPRALEILGLGPEAAEEFDAVVARVHRGDRARLARALEESARTGERLETEFRLDDGTCIEIRGVPARGSRQVAGTLRNITPQRRAREVLEERERRTVLALRGAGLGAWNWSSRSGQLRVDAQARRLHGREGEAGRVSLREWLSCIAPEDRRRVVRSVANPPEDGLVRLEYRLAGSNRVVVAEGHILGTGNSTRRRADGICRDVTEARVEEAGLRQDAVRDSGTLAALPGMVARADAEGVIVWANDAWQAAFPGAQSLAEALGKERLDDVGPRLESLPDGEPIHAPVVIAAGGRTREFDAFWTRAGDGMLVVLHDLSGRREADNRLFEVRKTDAVGRLAGGVAREFNNLLGVIVGSLELMEAELGGHPGARRRIGAAMGAARQGAEVTHRLLTFARQHDLEPELLDPGAFIRRRVNLLGRLLGDGALLELALEDETWPVHADPGQLETALVHLVSNAAAAISGGGRVTLRAGNRVLDSEKARRLLGPSATAGGYVEIAVEDTGPGIPEDIIDRVFDPFFTTRSDGRAAGLGLSFVWGFAQQSGGRAFIGPRPGGGTRASLLLPRRRPEAAEGWETATMRQSRPNRRTAVLVEPDPGLRETASDLLGSLGWEVRAARDPEHALELLAEDSAELLFTDLDPGHGLDGAMLARRAVAKLPGLAVVFSSSWGAPRAHSGHPVVVKPYGRSELGAALTRATEGEETHG